MDLNDAFFLMFKRFCHEAKIWEFIKEQIFKDYGSLSGFKHRMICDYDFNSGEPLLIKGSEYEIHGNWRNVLANSTILSFSWSEDIARWKSLDTQWKLFISLYGDIYLSQK